MSIPLTSDIDSHGCNGGWVGQLGMPAMATVEDSCGQFGGYESLLGNGAHLATYVIDGAFAGQWVHKLKWTAAFTIDASWDSTPDDTKWGIVTYGDCTGGSSFDFHIEKNITETIFRANLELMTSTGLQDYELYCVGVSIIIPKSQRSPVFFFPLLPVVICDAGLLNVSVLYRFCSKFTD